jgi:hypothetical protein
MHGGYAHDLVFYFLQKENKSANGQPFSRRQCEYGGKKTRLRNSLQKVQAKDKPIFL